MSEVAEYKVQLDNYYGPLDLLLHLVKETEVDITRITLAKACEQYINFLTAMEKLDIDLSGNFLSLASQLLLIKSRAIAPPEVKPAEGEPGLEEEEDEADASLELIKKLLDYKRFKDRARMLDLMAMERSQKFGRPRIKLEGETEVEPLRNLELWDLVLLYSKAIKGIRLEAQLSILYKDIPLELFIDKILRSLEQKPVSGYFELLGENPDRTARMGTFLALLQLAKSQRVRLDQDGHLADIRVEIVPESERPEEAPTVPDLAPVDLAKGAPREAGGLAQGAYGYSVVDDFNAVPIPLSERAEAKDPQAPPPAPEPEVGPAPAEPPTP
jgi:segregation and condensation protein A